MRSLDEINSHLFGYNKDVITNSEIFGVECILVNVKRLGNILISPLCFSAVDILIFNDTKTVK